RFDAASGCANGKDVTVRHAISTAALPDAWMATPRATTQFRAITHTPGGIRVEWHYSARVESFVQFVPAAICWIDRAESEGGSWQSKTTKNPVPLLATATSFQSLSLLA